MSRHSPTRCSTRIYVFLVLTLSQTDTTPAATGDEDDGAVETISTDGPDGLATLPTVIEDPERQFEMLHAARMLAEAGAGYEAARVVAAIASHTSDTEATHTARGWLKEWGLTVDAVRSGVPVEISAKIAENIHVEHHGGAQATHVGNLIRLNLLPAAARVLREGARSRKRREVARYWGDVLERYRIPIELLVDDASDTEEQLVEALRVAYERIQLRRQVQALWSIDHEAAEIGHMLLRHLDPERDRRGHDRDEERDEREGENHFARWVERRHDDEHEDDHEEHEPGIDELIPRAIERALRFSRNSPQAASALAKLVVETAPESLAADAARTIISKLDRPATTGAPPREPTGKEDPGLEIFGSTRVREYKLEISETALELLRKQPKQYVRATFLEGDDVYIDVGVRLKGSWGSFRMIDGRSKAAFTVKFNQFVKGQRFHGLRRVILNNGVQDPTYLHEHLGYSLFRDAGVPAPRIAHATLSVNGEPYGLYIQVEAVTEDFLKRWFARTGGNLYEGPGDVLDWRELDLDNNQQEGDRTDLRRLAEAIEQADEDDPWATLADLVHLDSFTRFLAMEHLLNHWDGYTEANNYRVYHDPSTKKFRFLPHGCDQLFDDPGGDIFRGQGGILGRALLQTVAGGQRYRRAMQRLLDEVWNEDAIRERIAEVYSRIHPYVASAQDKGRHGVEEFEHRVRSMLSFVSIRRHVVQSQLRRQAHRSWRQPVHHDGLPSFLRHTDRDW